MNNFNEVKRQWEEREIPVPPSTGYYEVIKKSKYLHKKQTLTQVILSLTVIILMAFFFYISAYRNNEVFLGLGIMVGSLLIRITVEYFSMMKKEGFRPDLDLKHYTGQLIKYYKARKYIHYMLTPLLFVAYIFGFSMLLPAFEQQLSSGFYTYILISSWAIFIALALLISIQIKKELKIIKELVAF